MEIWKDVPGYEGRYQVSNIGNVKSLDRGIQYRPNEIRYRIGRVLSFDVHRKGYLRVCIEGKKFMVHRLVSMAFIPNPFNLPEVNHKDLDKKNNRVENLEWVTSSQNVRHAEALGAFKKNRESLRIRTTGSNHKNAVLNEKLVLKIRAHYEEIGSIVKTAKHFGLNKGTVDSVLRRKSWKHI